MSERCNNCNGTGKTKNNGGDWGTNPDFTEKDFWGNYQGYDWCSKCDGTGKLEVKETRVYVDKRDCFSCSGTGEITIEEEQYTTYNTGRKLPNGKFVIKREKCSTCDGKGYHGGFYQTYRDEKPYY